uniref:Si:ch211-159i8.4 n=1 Tax=Danio rerio TaxID=7955 RepID=F1QCM6_DANRE|nr:matrix-remodeling-associated protein 5 [Danio rerio]XP_017214600.1 matrix-remodeling-associated protein 5 [Danio rerio]XP_021336818.1 matrix-remodeling-associated protein 5 [Danio rerio]XP_021336819.1 matrix-remodeling-associated protein 5 [Danio rerio]|eukprot:XP_001332376.5 matrix-remodeling-associated protein 5 [Danio rerio]
MAPVGVPALLMLPALGLLLILPSCLYACPRSCSCPSPKEVHCTFRHLPSAPRNLPQDTERLNLGYNSIGAVGSSDFVNLRKLEMLMLHGNDISSVSSGSFYHLRSLQILKLSYNKLKRVDPSLFEGLTSLVRLHLDHNLIDFIEPFSFNGLTSLKLLQLEGNRLQDLHSHTFITVSVLGTFWSSGLRHLHLADNQLEYLLPGTLQHLNRLEVLSLHGNPWACDCHLHWLLEWNKNHDGVIKCKKDRDTGDAGNCAACASPLPLNNSQILQLSTNQLTCDQPSLQSPLKIGESSMGEDQEPDTPYIKDLEHPLGHLTFILSDSHGNRAHVACNVTRPVEGTTIVWEPVRKTDEIAVNVTLRTLLECEIDRDALQNLWRLIAYYYESPAILERGTSLGNSSKVTFQYSQATSEESPYFTELKGHLMAEPAWLLQPRVTLQLNRRKTTTKKLVLNFSTFISKQLIGRGGEEDVTSSWAMIQRGAPGRIQSVLEHYEVSLDCSVLSSGHYPVEWMLPDLTPIDQTDSHNLRLENHRLVIKNTSIADSGLYHCFVRTDTNVDIVSYRLTVRMRLLSPSDLNGKKISVEKGDTLNLPCLVTSPHPIETKWYLPNNQILKASERKGNVQVSQNNTLIIKTVTHEDAGEYSCLAANLYGADMLSHLIVVTGEKEETQRGVLVSKGEVPLFESEGSEGSGYEEIKRPTAKLTPQKTDGKHRGGIIRQNTKGKKVKEGVRKPNNSVKELDPSRWEQIVAKANAKLSTVLPVTIHLENVITTTTISSSAIQTAKTDVTASGASTTSSLQRFNVKQLETAPHSEHVKQETTHGEESKQKIDGYNNSDLTTAVPEHETQLVKQVDRHTIEEKIRANNNSIWNQRRRLPHRQRRPLPRRPLPKRPNFTATPTTTVSLTQSPVNNIAMTTNSYSPAQDKDLTAPVTLEVTPAHYPVTESLVVAVTESTLKVPKTTRTDGKLNEFESKTKHIAWVQHISTTSVQETKVITVTHAPRLINRHEHENREFIMRINSQTNDDKIRQISATATPNLQISNINPPETKKAHTTKKPTLTYVDQQRVYNWGLHPEGVPIHPWLIQKNTPSSFTQSSSLAKNNGIPFWPTVQSSRHHHSQDKSWYFLQTGGRGAGVTNQPQISAQTVKPTVYISGSATASFPRTIAPHVSSSRVRDQLLFNRLRNRYRQTQLDAYRLAQLAKLATSKPRIYHPTPQPNQAPNVPNIYKKVTPPSILAYTNKPRPTASIPHGDRWHYIHFGAKKLSTAIPFPNLMGSGVKPRITAPESATVSALAEGDVLLSCRSSGDPKPVVSWTKVSTGATIQSNTKFGQRFEVLSNGTFVIKNVQLQDRGQYLCTAQNKFGSDRMVVTLVVQTQPPKIMSARPRDVSVFLGNPVNLDCIAVGKPEAQISWILPDRTFVRDIGTFDRKVSLFPNGTLSIHSANFSNKGDYKCIASNAAGADTLTYHIRVSALPPIIAEVSYETIFMNVGRNVYMDCTAKGEPLPLNKWVLPDGSEMKPTQFIGSRIFIFPNGTLYIKNVIPNDSGKYECSATNPIGFAKRTVQMDVRQEAPGPWKGLYQHHSVTATYGSTVFLYCPESIGSQRGTVWRLPSKTILEHQYSPHRHITAFPNGTLRILRLTEKDGGNYLCMYQRPNGEDMELFQVEVLMRPPKIENAGAQHKRVANGDNFLVDCIASGLPDPEVSWSLPDGTMINNALQSDDNGSRNRRYIIFGNGTLLLQQMGKKDEGNYTCYAKNTLGEDAMKVSVQVMTTPPQLSTKEPETMRVPFGQSTQIKCDAPGVLPHTIIWISPRNEIITSSSVKYQILNDGTLIIKKLTLADQGKYSCVAQNPAGANIGNVKLLVEVKEPQINKQSGQTVSKVLAVYFQTLLLDCKAEGMPEPQITWTTPYGMSLPTPYLGGRFQVHRNGTLELRGIRKTDEGRFLCIAKNYLGEASLVVDLEVASLAEKPSFTVPNIEVLPLKPDGDDIFLECRATGRPKPEILWILPSGTVLNPGMKLHRFTHYLENGTLHVMQPGVIDKGVYRCLAKNVAGQAEKRYSLELGQKPQIRSTAATMKISFGQTLNMPCNADGYPQATITWTLPNGLVLDKPQAIGRVVYLSNGTLQIKETSKLDRGTYTCKAKNTFGLSTLSYPVSIMVFPPQITHAPPSITRVNKGSPVVLNCIAAGIPKPDISWTLPGRTTLVPNNRFTTPGGIHMTEEGSLVIQDPGLLNSGIYKCNARNALGTDFKATYLQVI